MNLIVRAELNVIYFRFIINGKCANKHIYVFTKKNNFLQD